MKKISIIIPNYNGERYIKNCINSILNQSYKNVEIIIIDDGSIDRSREILKGYERQKNILIIYQNNLNASIARNEGMKYATGDFLLFLDSDDYLEDGALEKLITNLDESIDLVIGNYNNVNAQNEIIEKNRSIATKKEFVDDDILLELFDVNPVPSTKLYKMSIIKNNKLYWGNVRIGQDLNFYLKYLLCCKKVLCIEDVIYNYRVLKNSISRSFDYKIFDIIYSFDDVIKFCKVNDFYDLYQKYYSILELRHFNRQIEKQKYFKSYRERKLIVDFFFIQEKRINYAKCCNFNSYYKKIRLKYKLKKIFKYIYISKVYSFIKK